MDPYNKTKIVKIKNGSSYETEDSVAVEQRLRISVNGQNILNLYCTPTMVRELVAGLIYDEGIIQGEWCADRMSIEYGDDIIVDVPSAGSLRTGQKTITSGCAGGISMEAPLPEKSPVDGAVFSGEIIRNIYRDFQTRSELFRQTGGVHSAALTDGEKMLAFAEDIGRHNAVDKVIGYFVLEHLSFKDKILLVSGRLSSEIIKKSSRCGIPVIVSRAAPTSLAVKTAEEAKITLIGFIRGDRMNVYSGSVGAGSEV